MAPVVEWLILADKIEPNESGGVALYGVHNHIGPSEFPYVYEHLRFALYIVGEPLEEVRFTTHVYDGEVEIARTKEKVLQLDEIGQRIKLMSIDRVRFDHPGRYSVLLKSGDFVFAHSSLGVVER